MRNLLFLLFLSTVLAGSLIHESVKCAEPKGTKSSHKQLNDFRFEIHRGLTPELAIEIFGNPDRITGSGLTIFVYLFDNKNELWIGFPGNAPVLYAFMKHPDGSKTNFFP